MRPQSDEPPLDVRIAELAERQHGVVSVMQFEALGLGGRGVRHRVAAGRLHRIYRGVYAVGHPLLSSKGSYMAAVLACGSGAVLSHRCAADLHGLRDYNGARFDVTVPRR